MNLERRKFNGHLVKGALALSMVPPAFLLSGCAQQSTIQEVLKLLPTISGIITTVGTVISAVDPALVLPITAALAVIGSSFMIVQNILTMYESNLSGAPAGAIGTLDAAIAAIQTQISQIEAEFPNLSLLVKAGISVGLTAFQTILGFIASLLPAPAAAQLFPKAYARLAAKGIVFGTTVNVPSRRTFAINYNAQMDAAGWKGYKHNHIHVPLL